MDIQKRIEELTAQQQTLIRRTQEDDINIQRLAGAIAILNEVLGDEPLAKKAPNGKVKEKVEA